MPPALFDADIADLPDPHWLTTERRRRVETALEVEPPTTTAEEWRYSRIDKVDLASFAPAGHADAPRGTGTATAPPLAAAVIDRFAEHGGTLAWVATLDGVVVAHDATALPEGVTLGPPEQPDQFGTAAPVDALAAWNAALAPSPLLLHVPRSLHLEVPVVVVHQVDTAGAASFPRLVVRADEASAVTVVEVHVGAGEALSVPVTEVVVAAGARVAHTVVQDLGDQVIQIANLHAEVGQEATFDSAVAALGGDYARHRVDCHLVGRGATGNVAAAYLGDGNQMIDLRTFQEHVAPDTSSDLYFKGAVADSAHSVYTGLIRIRPGARGTNAVQANRVVKLSDDAWAESVPNLEIENNDVRCAHASTVGPVDEDQRFYLESRGVPPQAAERLIVGGFFDDALDHFPVPDAAAYVGARLDELLDSDLAPLGDPS